MDIKIYSLGHFSIINEIKPIQFNLKDRSKPILVLKVLIAYGGRNVKKEKISDAIWPDTDGDLAQKSLATTLHRLRRVLGTDEIITVSGGNLTLNSDICRCDVWEFERLYTKINKMWSHSTDENISETIQNALRAINLYRGPFLPEDIDQFWTVFLRERLRNRYQRITGKIGQYYESHGVPEKAIECFQHSIEADPTDEESYRRLMACYLRIGKRSKALSTYGECKKILYEGFGVELSRETEILRRSILISEQ